VELHRASPHTAGSVGGGVERLLSTSGRSRAPQRIGADPETDPGSPGDPDTTGAHAPDSLEPDTDEGVLSA